MSELRAARSRMARWAFLVVFASVGIANAAVDEPDSLSGGPGVGSSRAGSVRMECSGLLIVLEVVALALRVMAGSMDGERIDAFAQRGCKILDRSWAWRGCDLIVGAQAGLAGARPRRCGMTIDE